MEQLNIPLREVKQRLGHVTRYTDGRDYNEFSAKVWKRMKEMNVDAAVEDTFNNLKSVSPIKKTRRN
ncbi:hypothetical protein B0H14DRAFT_3474835 [Mycena olivaceomarginata]|nr:hypothetical protein B0H14DRAFT_3474835 [Mycena olivaceomarginata]